MKPITKAVLKLCAIIAIIAVINDFSIGDLTLAKAIFDIIVFICAVMTYLTIDGEL